MKKIPQSFLFFVLFGFIIQTNSFAQYTLTDNDVVVVNGVIESCSYNFSITDIIIPDVLDGQTVIWIADGYYNGTTMIGVFKDKGITSMVFPSTIQIIGIQSFSGNQITNIDISTCSSLTTINERAFYSNSISALDLSNCINLSAINYGAFDKNAIRDVVFFGCTNLQTIGSYAFRENVITKVDLESCSLLTSINDFAFAKNQIDTLLFLPNVTSLGCSAFRQNNIVCVNHVPSEGYVYARQQSGMDDSTHLNSYGGPVDSLIIPSNITVIGDFSVGNCEIVNVDFNMCVDLIDIGLGAFYSNYMEIVDLDSCSILRTIGSFSFSGNYISLLNISNCDSLERIGDMAFHSNLLQSIDLMECVKLKYIGSEAFKENPMTSFTLPTPNIPDSTFLGWEDSNGTMHAGGETVTDLITYYNAIFIETIDYTVTFALTDGTNPIENANVNLAGYGDQITDASGVAVFTDVIPEDNINYTIMASDYDEYIDSLSVVDTDVAENVELTLTTYNVTFVVEDINGSLENATVDFAGYGSQVTDINGVTVFTDVAPENDIVYTVISANYYDVTDSLSVVNVDVTDSVFMSLVSYSVTFNVSDGTTPVLDATVDLAGYGQKTTDISGTAVFDGVVPATDINYSVFCSGYISYNDSITVVDVDISEDVALTPTVTSYAVTFVVTDASNPVSDASVALTGYGSQLTDNQGIAIFNDVSPGNDIPYNITASSYNMFSGFVTVVDVDVDENVTLTLSSYDVTFEISDGNNNIADATVTLEGYGSQISDNDGIVIFNEVLPDLLDYAIAASSFFTVSGAIEVDNDDVYEYVLMNPTGVVDYDNKQITISPNPATSYINIANCLNNEVRIFNAEGVLLDCIVPDSDCYQVDISNISSGWLLFRIDNHAFKIIRK